MTPLTTSVRWTLKPDDCWLGPDASRFLAAEVSTRKSSRCENKSTPAIACSLAHFMPVSAALLETPENVLGHSSPCFDHVSPGVAGPIRRFDVPIRWLAVVFDSPREIWQTGEGSRT